MFAGVLRVAVVDDSALYRRMILNVLAMIPGVEVVGTASNGFEAIELICKVSERLFAKLAPQVV